MKQRKNIRIKYFDYSEPGEYFITICTRRKKQSLGSISNGQINLNNIGIIVEKYWLEIPNHFDNFEIDEYIIMPNHLHGIIVINHGYYDVGTCHGMSLPKNEFSNLQPRSISMAINHFKGSVKRWCNQNGYPEFAWQSKFYEHIIRNEKSLNRIRNYIINNPYYWYCDPDNPNNYY